MKYATIGIDVSKQKLDICILPTGEILQYPNTQEGIKQFCKLLSKHTFTQILMEDTGCYHKALLNFSLKKKEFVNI